MVKWMGSKKRTPPKFYIFNLIPFWMRIDHALDDLFTPESVAVVGASAKEGSIGYNLVRNIVEGGYAGKVFPVNPKYDEVHGLKCFKSTADLPHPADLTIMAVHADISNSMIEEACKNGARTFINIASGFGEVGRRDLEIKMREIVRKYGARVLGPNVFGVYSARASLNATFGLRNVVPGNVGLISQSGALGIALMGMTQNQGIGLSAVISIGNKADISECEALEYLGADDRTKAIFLYIEGTKDGRRLMEVASEVSKIKPIVAIKSGSSVRGALAAASHTGSLAGSDKIFTTALEQAGVLRALNLNDGFNWLRALSQLPIPGAEGVVVVTNGGGIGVMSTDSAERYRVKMLDNRDLFEKMFRKTMPDYGNASNPIDITGQGKNKEYGMAFDIALDEPKIPAIVGLYCQTADGKPMEIAKAAIDSAARSQHRKPITFSMVGGKGIRDAMDELNQAGIPCYGSPDEAMSAMGALYKRHRRLLEEKEEPVVFNDINLNAIQSIIDRAKEVGATNLIESDCNEILRLTGLQFPKSGVAGNLDEAVALAQKIGFPVAMKVLSPDIIHKTEFGAVRLDLEDEHEVRVAYESIMASVRSKMRNARIEGVIVTEMICEATETILGFSEDPSFGPVLMFGMGGIYVEVLKDVAFRVAPISGREVMKMIRDITSYPILAGARGKDFRDIDGISDAISRISYLATQVDDLVELDINPFMALDKGMGCKVVDSRMTIRPKEMKS